MNSKFIVHLYIDSKMSIDNISRMFNISFYKIRAILVQNNIEIREVGPIRGKKYS